MGGLTVMSSCTQSVNRPVISTSIMDSWTVDYIQGWFENQVLLNAKED